MYKIEPITNIEKLRNILNGKDTSIPRPQALSMLLLSDYPYKERELKAFLINSKESYTIRQMAATSLGNMDSQEAREILIKSSKSVKGDLLGSVVIAMSKYGDKDSLDAISTVKKQSTGFVRSQAGFAAALISYRLGLKGNELSPPNEKGFLKVSEDSRRIVVEKANELELRICLETIGEKPFGLELSQRPAYQFNLGYNCIILLNRDFANAESIKKLLKRKAIPGIITQKNVETGSYFVSYLILTSPKRQSNEINIWFARSHGKISYGGTAKIKDGEMKFSIRSISMIGVVPLIVEGTIRYDGFELKKARFSGVIPIRKHPTAET